MGCRALAPPLCWAILCVGFILGVPVLMVTAWLQQLQPSHLHTATFKGGKGAVASVCL